jgi:hypothetical protein
MAVVNINIKENDMASMINEIIDALEDYFNDEDIVTDCLIYLDGAIRGDRFAPRIISDWFENHDRCNCCGMKLFAYTYQEPHPELDGCPCETLTEMLCLNCDKIGCGEIEEDD